MRKNRLLYWMVISLLCFATITGCNSKEGSNSKTTQVVEQEGASSSVQESAELEYQAKTLLIKNEGREIPCVLTLPSTEGEVPLIVMTHGFAGNKDEGGGFVKISKTLANAGFATLRMDFAGCGESTSDFIDFNLDNNKSDVKACLKYVLEEENIDQQRIGIFGYSMGGALAVLLSEEESSPYKAMVLLAPGTPTNEERVTETEQMIKEAQETGYTSIDWFGNKINVGIDYYKGLLNAFDAFRNYDNTCDAIVIYGDEDKIVFPEYSKAFADQMGVESVLINGADHGYGFYSEQPEVTEKLLDTVSGFFEKEFVLK